MPTQYFRFGLDISGQQQFYQTLNFKKVSETCGIYHLQSIHYIEAALMGTSAFESFFTILSRIMINDSKGL